MAAYAGPRPTAPPTPQGRTQNNHAFVARGNGQPRAQNVNRAPKGPPNPPPSTRGHWVPQGDNWQLIHAVGKGKWAPGGVAGAKAPAKPTGPTPLPNNPLAPLTQNQIQRQAAKTVTAAYGPATGDLNNQTQQALNLNKAQAADNQYFAQWLAGQTQSMNTKIGTANAALASTLQGFQQSQQADLQAAQAASTQGLESQLGSTVAPSQVAGAVQNETNPMIANAGARTAGAAAQGIQDSLYQSVAGQNAGDVGQARIAAKGTAELGTLNTTLNSIAAQRAKLTAGQISDTAKEITRLQGVELSKRQWNISEQALLDKAGVANKVALAGATSKRISANASAANAATNAAKAKETAAHNAAMEKISQTHYANQAAHDAAVAAETARHNRVDEGLRQQSNNTAAAKAAKGAAGSTTKGQYGPGHFGTPEQQRAATNYVDSLRQALITDIQRFHPNDPNALKLAYHDILSPRAGKAGITIPKPPTGTNIAAWMNAAANSLVDHGAQGLTPGDIAFLNQQGLQVGSRYARATGGQSYAGASTGRPSAGNLAAAGV